MSSPTIGIILGNFYLLILLLEKLSTWTRRLPFAVNIILKLSGIVVR